MQSESHETPEAQRCTKDTEGLCVGTARRFLDSKNQN